MKKSHHASEASSLARRIAALKIHATGVAENITLGDVLNWIVGDDGSRPVGKPVSVWMRAIIAQKLLLGSDKSLRQIARETGYTVAWLSKITKASAQQFGIAAAFQRPEKWSTETKPSRSKKTRMIEESQQFVGTLNSLSELRTFAEHEIKSKKKPNTTAR